MQKKKILVVDDMAICREPIADALRGRGYDVTCAASGEEALGLLREQRPDVILLDMTMPGLNGLAVLRSIRSNPVLRSLPVIMLTDKSDRESVATAASYHIQGYLLKSNFSLSGLLERVESCFGQVAVAVPGHPSEEVSRDAHGQRPVTHNVGSSAKTSTAQMAPQTPQRQPDNAQLLNSVSEALHQAKSLDDLKPIITKNELIKLVNKGLELRPLGPSVQNVMAATSTAGCSADDVGKAISQDQALSIRILKIANSSVYSRGRPVDSIREAVQRIGISEVRRMVMSLGVVQKYEEAALKHLDPRLFWEHSTACGLIAAAIAKARQDKNPDDYFLRGALHDVGRLILFEHVPEAYKRVWDAADLLELPLEAVEPKLMVLDHCDILERALEHWQFPREFIAPVVNHHRSIGTIRRLGGQHAEGAAIIALADRLAHVLLLGSSGNDVIYPFNELAEFLSLSPQVLAEIANKIVDETHDLKFSMLAKAHEAAWPDFAVQVRKQLRVPLHPLYLCSDTKMDAFRMFCDRVADTAVEATPNLAIAYLRTADELSQMIIKLEAQENNLCVRDLPILIVTSGVHVEPNQVLLGRRRHAYLAMPMRLVSFLRSVAELLKVASA